MLQLLKAQTKVVLAVSSSDNDTTSILSIILSIGKMKWNDPDLLTSLCSHIRCVYYY